MEQLIFFGIIILFSIAESIARSRRARQQKESGEAEPERFEWAQRDPADEELATYDQDRSYDEIAVETMEARSAPAEAPRPEPAQSDREITSTRDLFEELAGLAKDAQRRAEAEARPPPTPRRSPPLPPTKPDREQRREPTTVARRRPGTLRPRPEEHPIHLSHAGYGTDPSERARSEQDGLDPLAEHLDPEAAAVRAQLRSGSTSALHRAMILHEVLGPPLALKD